MARSDRLGSKQRYGLAAAILCNAVNAAGLSLALPLLSVTLEARGASAFMIGLIAAMSGVATLIVSPFASLLIHRFGVSRSLIGSIVVSLQASWRFTSPNRFGSGSCCDSSTVPPWR